MSNDDALIALFDLVDAYQELQSQCFSTLSKAYFDLAQARKVMGRSLSPIAFDARMKAVVAVTPESEPKESDVNELDDLFQNLSLTRTAPTFAPTAEKDKSDGVRRRKPPSANEEPQQDPENDEKQEPPKDPLKWFGVLVPPALRSAQGGFQRALESAVRLANLRHELVLKYRELEGKESEETEDEEQVDGKESEPEAEDSKDESKAEDSKDETKGSEPEQS